MTCLRQRRAQACFCGANLSDALQAISQRRLAKPLPVPGDELRQRRKPGAWAALSIGCWQPCSLQADLEVLARRRISEAPTSRASGLAML
jgi:hypothetical protein